MRKKLYSWSTWKKNLNEMKFLKIYDPDPMNSFYTKAKLMKQELERTYGSKFQNYAGNQMQTNFLRLIHFF